MRSKAIFLVLAIGLSIVPSYCFSTERVDRSWLGLYPTSELDRFPTPEIEGFGFISDQARWNSVWEAFSPEPAPEIDFSREMVIYARNTIYLNELSPLYYENIAGVITAFPASTLSAIPIEDQVYWTAGTIPLEGVTHVGLTGSETLLAVPEPSVSVHGVECGLQPD